MCFILFYYISPQSSHSMNNYKTIFIEYLLSHSGKYFFLFLKIYKSYFLCILCLRTFGGAYSTTSQSFMNRVGIHKGQTDIHSFLYIIIYLDKIIIIFNNISQFNFIDNIRPVS